VGVWSLLSSINSPEKIENSRNVDAEGPERSATVLPIKSTTDTISIILKAKSSLGLPSFLSST
jgi:hypothetical protein